MQFLKWGLAGAVALGMAAMLPSAPAEAQDKSVKIRVQAVIPKSADEVRMFEGFAANVKALTKGTVTFEVLPAGAIVGVAETLDAVDKGLVEAGLAWTHFWSGKHPAAMPPMSSGSPMRRSGVVASRSLRRLSSSQSARAKSVLTRPGAMQLQRTFLGPHSTARLRASEKSAAFEMP